MEKLVDVDNSIYIFNEMLRHKYYFDKLFNRFGIERDTTSDTTKMYFLLSDNYATFCCYDNSKVSGTRSMSLDGIKKGLQFCRENFMMPVFVHGDDQYLEYDFSHMPVFEEFIIQHILPIGLNDKAKFLKKTLYIFDHTSVQKADEPLDNCIYNIQQADLAYLAEDVIRLLSTVDRVNVNVLNLNAGFDEACYLEQLRAIKDYLIKEQSDSGTKKEINLLTDLCYSTLWNNCRAGERTFAYAPDGQSYTCPAFYRENSEWVIGNPESGISQLKNARLYRREYHPICQVCDAKQCRNCIHRNLEGTKDPLIFYGF